MESIKEVVRGIRNARAQMNVPASKKTKVYIVGKDQAACAMYEKTKKAYSNLALAKEILVQPDKAGIGEDAVSIVVSDAVVYLPLDELVDREKEIERLNKEQDKLQKEIARCEGMLGNPNFVGKAPAKKIEEEKAKLQKYQDMLEKVKAQLATM